MMLNALIAITILNILLISLIHIPPITTTIILTTFAPLITLTTFLFTLIASLLYLTNSIFSHLFFVVKYMMQLNTLDLPTLPYIPHYLPPFVLSQLYRFLRHLDYRLLLLLLILYLRT
jgi:hypothetical protein